MATLFRYEFYGLEHEPLLSKGDPITVQGTPMVRLATGTIVPAAGFHATLADATLDAARKLAELVRPVLQRITRLQDESVTLREKCEAAS